MSGQGRGHPPVHLRRRFRQPGQVVVDQSEWIAATERRSPGGHFVQGRAQRIQVGSLVHLTAGPSGLFGRHIGQSADDLRRAGGVEALIGQQGGDMEVDKFRMTVGSQQDVARADVAVKHTSAVHRADDAAERQRDAHQLGVVHVAEGQHLRARPRIRVLHEDPVGQRFLLDQLWHTSHTGQPTQHRPLMTQPVGCQRADRLLADNAAWTVRFGCPEHPGEFPGVQDFFTDPDGEPVARTIPRWCRRHRQPQPLAVIRPLSVGRPRRRGGRHRRSPMSALRRFRRWR